MKKFVFTLLLVFVCHLGYAQSINGLFNEFGSEKNADCVKVSSFMMSLGKMFAGHDEDAEIIRKIKSIKVLDLESCTASVKERFSKKVNRLSLKGYFFCVAHLHILLGQQDHSLNSLHQYLMLPH